SSTSAVANITISTGAAPGTRTVTATTVGESASLVDGFLVTAGVPRITAIRPPAARQGDELAVDIDAEFTNFIDGVTTADFGPGIVVTRVTVLSPVRARVELTIADEA